MSAHVVYIYWAADEPLYVGKSRNLALRMKNHTDRPFAKASTHITVWEFDSAADADAVEVHTIQKLRPRFNSMHNVRFTPPSTIDPRLARKRHAATVIGRRIQAAS